MERPYANEKNKPKKNIHKKSEQQIISTIIIKNIKLLKNQKNDLRIHI